MDTIARLLVASSDARVCNELHRVVLRCRVQARFVSSFREAQAILSCEPVSLVVCGFALEDGTYCDVLQGLRHDGIHVPVVVASDPDNCTEFDCFLKALHHGAYDFLCFPYFWYELRSILEQAQRELALGPWAGVAHESNSGDLRESPNLA